MDPVEFRKTGLHTSAKYLEAEEKMHWHFRQTFGKSGAIGIKKQSPGYRVAELVEKSQLNWSTS